MLGIFVAGWSSGEDEAARFGAALIAKDRKIKISVVVVVEI